MLSDVCEREEHEICFEDELDGCRCACHPDPLDGAAGESTGACRAQNARAGSSPSPPSAPPARVSPRCASAGTSTPAHLPSQVGPRAGVDPPSSAAAESDLALGAVADQTPPGAGRRRAAGAAPGGSSSPMEADGAVPGGDTRPGGALPLLGAPPGRGEAGSRVNGLPRSWILELPPGMPLLSLNGREHWSVRNRRTQALKDAAIVLARQAKIPRLQRVSIVAEYQPPDRRRRDADNPIPSAKACVDGLVAAGCLLDDSAQYVTSVAGTIGPVCPMGRLVLTVTEVAP